MALTVGTSHFVSVSAARRYYRPYEGSDTNAAVTRKIAEGEIHIGPPMLKPGQTLIVIDGGTRYATTEPETSNPDCNGSGPHTAGEVRVLPTGGSGNAILCRACYKTELAWRTERNKELGDFARFSLPAWDSLKVYGADEEQNTLYKALTASGVQTDHHESDLYFPVNPTSDAILALFPDKKATTFRSQSDGSTWYEVPFSYDPFWEQKAGN